MSEVHLQNISVARAGRPVLAGIDLRCRAGEFLVVLGPNGAGKTTLLRAALGLVRPDVGTARIDGQDAAKLAPAARARMAAYLPQTRPLAWPMLARDVVALGRFAHGAAVGALGPKDAETVARAMKLCDIETLAARRTDKLSGGELARVHVARAFAGAAPILVADEPTAALDPLHAWRIMALIADFVSGGGAAIVATHDLALALRFATRVCLLHGGCIIRRGPPAEVLTAAAMAEAYGVAAEIDGGSIALTGPIN